MDEGEETDEEERADAALFDDERALATHVARVTLRIASRAVGKDANAVEELRRTCNHLGLTLPSPHALAAKGLPIGACCLDTTENLQLAVCMKAESGIITLSA